MLESLSTVPRRTGHFSTGLATAPDVSHHGLSGRAFESPQGDVEVGRKLIGSGQAAPVPQVPDEPHLILAKVEAEIPRRARCLTDAESLRLAVVRLSSKANHEVDLDAARLPRHALLTVK